MQPGNYLPDELLLEVLTYLDGWEVRERQTALARFAAVNRYAVLDSLILSKR
jgi:hypothetical protein